MKKQLVIALIGRLIFAESLCGSDKPIFYEKNYIAMSRWIKPFTCQGIIVRAKKGLPEKIRLVAKRVNLLTGKSTVRGTVLLSDFPENGIKIGAVPLGYQYRLYAYLIEDTQKNFATLVSAHEYLNFEILDAAQCAPLNYEPLMFKYQLSPADKALIAVAVIIVAGLGLNYWNKSNRKPVTVRALYARISREGGWQEQGLPLKRPADLDSKTFERFQKQISVLQASESYKKIRQDYFDHPYAHAKENALTSYWRNQLLPYQRQAAEDDKPLSREDAYYAVAIENVRLHELSVGAQTYNNRTDNTGMLLQTWISVPFDPINPKDWMK